MRGRRAAGWAAGLAIVLSAATLRAETVAQRYPALASKLQCTCGCATPMPQECETMKCSTRKAIDADIVWVETGPMRNDRMAVKLQYFEQKYGSRILMAPPTSGFGMVVWIMPWVAAGLGLWLVFFSIRYWRKRALPAAAATSTGEASAAAAPPAGDKAALEQVRAEMDRELRGF